MYPEILQRFAHEKNLSLQDSAQTFLQIIVLKLLSLPDARFMGDTALTLGYGNPRFSEDIDLAQVSSPGLLGPSLTKAARELENWFASPVVLRPPKVEGRTWRLTIRLGRAESLSLHVDSQKYRAYTSQPIIIQYPSIPSFVVETMTLDEILAEKTLALAYRRYLGGRDLFDLWFHLLGKPQEVALRLPSIQKLVKKKLHERSRSYSDFLSRLNERLSHRMALQRARAEWKRYLPLNFQKPSVFEAIVSSIRKFPEAFGEPS